MALTGLSVISRGRDVMGGARAERFFYVAGRLLFACNPGDPASSPECPGRSMLEHRCVVQLSACCQSSYMIRFNRPCLAARPGVFCFTEHETRPFEKQLVG
ncbi:hypothetical protein BaRGS_00008229 [Batillaria attramentaria]|uniref:Uncharacterized protein n=1 Tax=Batillaria attramentaria TaxID=370345 RepID=A0ABD0LMI8_9CAEN